jgi:predicted lipoprotein with Yx(FWY)xxD motif
VERRHADLLARLAPLAPAEALDALCGEALVLAGMTGSAVVLMSAHESGSVAAHAGTLATAVEDLQFTLGEGPCLTAFQTGRAVVEDDIAACAQRWPAFAPAAEETGARGVYALPLRLGAIRLGVLYLVRATAGVLEAEGLVDAYYLATLATVLLLAQGGSGQVGRLPDGWSDRAVVHQATGMISARLDLPLADALARIRATAYAEERSIYDLAVDIVARHVTLTESGGEALP